MTLNENHARAIKMVSNWPSWKREVSLTKHPSQAFNPADKTDDHSKKGSEPKDSCKPTLSV